jgi:hypothetical protein
VLRRISVEVTDVLGFAQEDCVGVPVLDAVHLMDAPTLLSHMTSLALNATAGALHLRVRRRPKGWQLSRVVAPTVPGDLDVLAELSPRQHEVLQRLVSGQRTPVIARDLFLRSHERLGGLAPGDHTSCRKCDEQHGHARALGDLVPRRRSGWVHTRGEPTHGGLDSGRTRVRSCASGMNIVGDRTWCRPLPGPSPKCRCNFWECTSRGRPPTSADPCPPEVVTKGLQVLALALPPTPLSKVQLEDEVEV